MTGMCKSKYMVEKWFLENCYVMAILLQMKIGESLYICKRDFVWACCNYWVDFSEILHTYYSPYEDAPWFFMLTR